MEIEKRYYAEVCFIGELESEKSQEAKGVFTIKEGKSYVNLLNHGFEYCNGSLKYTGNETLKFIGSVIGKVNDNEENEIQFLVSLNTNIINLDQEFSTRNENTEKLIHGIFEVTLKKNDVIEIVLNQEANIKDVKLSIVVK